MAPNNAIDYERTDAKPWLIVSLGAGIAAFVVLTPLALTLAYPRALHVTPVRATLGEVPPPRLQVYPAREFASSRQAENRHLEGYGWSDRDKGTLHIPIDRAISLVQERGLPGWQKP
jgi:hypothetical protein